MSVFGWPEPQHLADSTKDVRPIVLPGVVVRVARAGEEMSHHRIQIESDIIPNR